MNQIKQFSVSGNAIGTVGKIVDSLERFIFLKHSPTYLLIAVWIVATYLYEDFEYMGYLFIYSPEKECGKSRVLDVLDLLVSRSSGVLGDPTPAVLFHTATNKTQLLDEADTWRNGDDLRAMLNQGFHKKGKVIRMHKDINGNFEPKEFATFCPRAIAGIGWDTLPDPTRSRAFGINMVRQTKGERRERLGKAQENELLKLQREIADWAASHKSEILQRYEKDRLDYLQAFGDRTIDIARPLFAITEVAFADGGIEKMRSQLMAAVTQTRFEESSSESKAVQMLSALHEITSADEPLVGSASELMERIGVSVPDISQYDVSSALTRFGFKNKSVRRNGSVRKCYQLRKEDLADIIERFGVRE